MFNKIEFLAVTVIAFEDVPAVMVGGTCEAIASGQDEFLPNIDYVMEASEIDLGCTHDAALNKCDMNKLFSEVRTLCE